MTRDMRDDACHIGCNYGDEIGIVWPSRGRGYFHAEGRLAGLLGVSTIRMERAAEGGQT